VPVVLELNLQITAPAITHLLISMIQVLRITETVCFCVGW